MIGIVSKLVETGKMEKPNDFNFDAESCAIAGTPNFVKTPSVKTAAASKRCDCVV